MGWYFFGLLIYFLVLLAESALVAVSPQEIEQLRNENGRTARRAVALAREIRPTMASLLLARLLLILMLVVYPAAQLLKAPIVRTSLYETSQQLGLPEFFTWFAAALAFATLVGIVFSGLQKIRIYKRVSGW
ncbi:MAG: hypothetical protein KDC61_23615, partial [Saprospiraceae bacterium]|nr:hypothetical protein [Saprospiraceae bacterium]